MIPAEEQRHVDTGPRPGELPSGVGTTTVLAHCRGDADSVAERARDVLRAVLAHAGPPWPALADWRNLLPNWFVDSAAPERSQEEAQRWLVWWRSLPPDKRAKAAREEIWTLANWLYWLEPEERQWFWWDALVENPQTLRVTVEIRGWPVPLGTLNWLLRAAGAVQVDEEPAGV